MNPKNFTISFTGVFIIAGVLAFALWLGNEMRHAQNVSPDILGPTPLLEPGAMPKSGQGTAEVIATGLQIPWELVFLPDSSLLITERPGTLKKIETETKKIINVPGVHHVGEGGLLGICLHPDFEKNHYLYLYLTTKTDRGLMNRVERYRFQDDKLDNRTVIIENIPGASSHDGGRIKFGPDRLLYITTGDAEDSAQAQDTNSLAGKILRLTDEGKIPGDNPFGNAIYSYGHRNPQGITWDGIGDGRLWATEHGSTATDEINLIEKGKNYGWPVIRGDQKKEGMESPKLQSGTSTWAPAGLVFFKGKLFFTGLRGEALYEVAVTREGKLESFKTHLKGEFGRLRAIAVSPDGYLYITTSNRDGRGDVKEGDDKIIKVTLP